MLQKRETTELQTCSIAQLLEKRFAETSKDRSLFPTFAKVFRFFDLQSAKKLEEKLLAELRKTGTLSERELHHCLAEIRRDIDRIIELDQLRAILVRGLKEHRKSRKGLQSGINDSLHMLPFPTRKQWTQLWLRALRGASLRGKIREIDEEIEKSKARLGLH